LSRRSVPNARIAAYACSFWEFAFILPLTPLNGNRLAFFICTRKNRLGFHRPGHARAGNDKANGSEPKKRLRLANLLCGLAVAPFSRLVPKLSFAFPGESGCPEGAWLRQLDGKREKADTSPLSGVRPNIHADRGVHRGRTRANRAVSDCGHPVGQRCWLPLRLATVKSTRQCSYVH